MFLLHPILQAMKAKSIIQSISVASSNDPVNILEVIGNSSIGGMENYIKNFIAHLPPDQFRVTCICPYESAFTTSLRELGVEDVFITPVADDPAWRSIQLTAEVARLHRVDVLHAHMPKAHVLAGLAGCLIHKPVVATIHGMNVTSHELGIKRAVGSHLITNCQEAYTQALAMGVPADEVAIVRNGVDTTLFTPGRDGEELRKAINVPQGTPLVGFVGRLEHEKGPDLFLRAAEYVHHLRSDVHFVIIGDGSMRNKLDAMCSQMDLEQRVHFVGWWENTFDIYPALNVLVHTSRSDGTSLVLLEAMACGCPTIGLAVGGVPEIIENDCTGLIAGAGDWEAVGIKTVQLLEQPERLERMGAAARYRVKQHFDLVTNTGRTAELLRNIAFDNADDKVASSSTMMSDLVAKVQ
jgi:glycosyltransferase involved in cell wall biosynthesis